MRNSLRGMIELIDPFAWPLLLIALGADLLIVDAGRIIAIGVGDDWISTQMSLAPFTRNAALLIVALAVMVKIPPLLLSGEVGFTIRRFLVLLSLCAVGAAVLQATDRARLWLTMQDITWFLGAVAVCWATVRCRSTHLLRAATVAFVLSLFLPRLWRYLMQLGWGTSEALNSLQMLSDSVPLVAGAALALSAPIRRSVSTVIAVCAGIGVTTGLIFYGFAGREVLRDATGLLLTSFSPTITAILFGLMVFAFVRILCELLRDDQLGFWRLGLLLLVLAKMVPDRGEQLLGSFLALIALSNWTNQPNTK